ncbi:MAG: DNA polymerase III subunit gamma/tau [Oscillospiraceae bacterium]|jgi:DNA polymerase-3 subunit gamma/tau
MYQALYRKWRPRSFDDVVGQEHITETLKNQVQTGHLSHAYLFVGTRGTGKTTCAKILAKAVNCERPVNGNPCNECASCCGIDDGSILDVVELDAASNNGVDNVRALRDEAVFSPVSVKKRVYIIDEVHMLSTSAFNALLKILEEPPEHLLFILATTELQKVPATILSRCQRHSFKRITPTALAGRIRYVAEQEHMKLDPDAAELLARLADGSLRDGLSLLDQCSGYDAITSESVLSAMGLAGKLRIAELLEKISAQDTQAALSVFTDLWQDGKSPVSLLKELSALLRDVLMCKVAPKGGSGLLSGNYAPETLRAFAARMTKEELLYDIDTVQGSIASLRDGRDPRTSAELCLVMLSQPELGESLGALRLRVAKLEKRAENVSVQNVNKYDEAPEQAQRVENPDNTYEKVSDLHENAPTSLEDEPPFDMDEPPISEERGKGLEAEPEAPPNTVAMDEREFTEKDAPPVPEAEPVPLADGDELWRMVAKELLETLNPGQATIVRNQADGSFDGRVLTITVASGFAKGQLEQGPTMERIRAAVEHAAGRQIPVQITISEGGQSANTEKLKADLSQFGNVKFE